MGSLGFRFPRLSFQLGLEVRQLLGPLCRPRAAIARSEPADSGWTTENMAGFRMIERMEPARIRSRPSSGMMERLSPRLPRMKENSPTWERLADTVNAVFAG